MMNKIASICGVAFGRCLKLYIFSMIPAVWFWFPIICIVGLFNEKRILTSSL